MNSQRLDKLLGWLSTGCIAITIGAVFFVAGWLSPALGGPPVRIRSSTLDPQIALAGAIIFFAIGVFFTVRALIGKLRSDD